MQYCVVALERAVVATLVTRRARFCDCRHVSLKAVSCSVRLLTTLHFSIACKTLSYPQYLSVGRVIQIRPCEKRLSNLRSFLVNTERPTYRAFIVTSLGNIRKQILLYFLLTVCVRGGQASTTVGRPPHTKHFSKCTRVRNKR